MPKLPDFIIIGAMKSATSSLQEQLCQQPGIFMSDPKEPNFFSDDHQYSNGIGWYAGLFAETPESSICGEASTHYTKLPTYPNTVQRLHAALPNARLLYVMRHPLDRLVSHYIHEWSMGSYNCSIEAAIMQYQELTSYGEYASQLEPYFSAFGRSSVLPVFFDRLVSNPQSELERVCRFIGYAGHPRWLENLQPSNVSSDRIRAFPFYSLVVESALATWVRRTFVPQGIRNAVKSRMSMKNRPEISSQTRNRLEGLFDEDLGQLGEWLGVELNCSNFKETTTKQSLNWITSDDI